MSDATGVIVNWEKAACIGKPQHWFFPDNVQGQEADYSIGVPVCQSCPIQRSCAAYGADEEFGLWGGLTPRERGLDGLYANRIRGRIRKHQRDHGLTVDEIRRRTKLRDVPQATWDRALELL